MKRSLIQSKRARVAIVCPATDTQNNGNWRTAARWKSLLSEQFNVSIYLDPNRETLLESDLMIALHARRSAPAIQHWRQVHPHRPLIVALTGTDLYKDIQNNEAAQTSLVLADRLVVLQDQGIVSLPKEHQAKTHCIFQSTSSWKPANKTNKKCRAVMVGHLRAEKSPQTYFEAARALSNHSDIQFDHIGDGLDASLLQEALELDDQLPHYRYLGPLSYAQTRRRIRDAHVLIHPSQMEGGAHVVMEAVCSGTPVLASRIAGNIGMLGQTYEGYFEWGQVDQLCELLKRCRNSQLQTNHTPRLLEDLTKQCNERAYLFSLTHEQHSLMDLLNELLPK